MRVERVLKAIIVLGLLLASLGFLLTNRFFHILEPQSIAFNWAKLAENFGTLSFMTVITFQGTYEICKNGISSYRLAELGFGVSLFIAYIFFLGIIIKAAQPALNPEGSISKISIEDIKKSKISPLEKEILSIRIAKDTYYYEGASMFLKASGEVVNYTPSAIEIADAEARKQKVDVIEERINKLKFYFKLYIALPIFSVLFAYLLAMHNKSLRSLDSF